MLFHSRVPLFLWVEAFTAAVHLLNRLSLSTFNLETLNFKMHGSHLDYSSLHMFSS